MIFLRKLSALPTDIGNEDKFLLDCSQNSLPSLSKQGFSSVEEVLEFIVIGYILQLTCSHE